MKKIYVLVLIAFCVNTSKTNAQGIYQHWGITIQGNDDDQGTVYSTRPDGGGHKMRPAFPISTPGGYVKGKGLVYNNKIYTVAGGGPGSSGIIIAFDPADNTYQRLADLYSIGGLAVSTNLVLYNNRMYGISSLDQSGTDGFIFEFDPANNSLIRKFNFSSTDYNEPSGGLALLGDELWGTASSGTIAIRGGIYSYDLGSGVYTPRHDFIQASGIYCYSPLSTYNNKLYGVTFNGGANLKGVLFEFNPATDIYMVRHVFSGGNDGAEPFSELTYFHNKFYGQTREEGANGYGTIFEFDPNTNIFNTRHQNTALNGGNNEGGFTIYNNRLYTINFNGGIFGSGSIIEYDAIANTVTKKVDCDFPNGNSSKYTMNLYNGKMYGLAAGGIDHGGGYKGVYFEFDPAGNTMTKRIQFGENQGLYPMGAVNYINGKVYGIARFGGANNRGVIWEYDLATYTYTPRHHFGPGQYSLFNRGMTLYNGKLYGCTDEGGNFGNGTLFVFDPANYSFTTLHHFNDNNDEGSSPRAQPVVFNNKLYGTCASGPTLGTIWEYDLLTNTHATKVEFTGGSWGISPVTGLTELNGSLWGVCFDGGIHGDGTMFQYFPAINGIVKRFDFDGPVTGGTPDAALVAANNKLYGTTTQGNKLFEFNPAGMIYTIKANLFDVSGNSCQGRLLWNEETQKFYGTTLFGGSAAPHKGILFEYDVPNNLLDRKLNFNPAIGSNPQYGELRKVPAFVAPGNPGNCSPGGSANVDASNWNDWIPFTNVNGDAVVEINPNGNNLGRVLVNFYVHDGPTRQKNGFYYLDRNITITSDNQPVTPVSVRLYIRKTEFDKLKNTPGSGIANIGNLSVFKNADACSNTMSGSSQVLPTNVSAWGGDYVFSTTVSSFSTFYFASSLAVLPVHLLSLTGTKEGPVNKLNWKATCDNPVWFVIERSADGINFAPIGTVSSQNCSSSFQFIDPNPVGKAWYRLKMIEQNSAAKYSNQVLLNRDRSDAFDVNIVPNPVVGTTANLQIISNKKMNVTFMISDLSGRIVTKRSVNIIEGTNTFQVPVTNLAAGVCQLIYNDGEKNHTLRFLKQ